MAIEDAGRLASPLRACDYDYKRALAKYPIRRLLRTARIQPGSRALWGFYHAEGIVRNVELSERSVEDSYNFLAWIRNGDPAGMAG